MNNCLRPVLALALVLGLIGSLLGDEAGAKKPAKPAKPTRPAKPEKPTKPDKPSKIKWAPITSASGELKKPEYNRNQRRKEKPVQVEFSTEAAGFRVSWTTEPAKERGGAMVMTLYKEIKRGKRESNWQRYATVGRARGKSEGNRIIVGSGSYYIELTGQDIKYDIKIEAAEKNESAK